MGSGSSYFRLQMRAVSENRGRHISEKQLKGKDEYLFIWLFMIPSDSHQIPARPHLVHSFLPAASVRAPRPKRSSQSRKLGKQAERQQIESQVGFWRKKKRDVSDIYLLVDTGTWTVFKVSESLVMSQYHAFVEHKELDG